MITMSDLTKAVAHALDIPLAKAQCAVDAVTRTIADELAGGGEVRVQQLGTFATAEHAARTGRNPRTGEPIEVAARLAVKFRPGKALRDRLNPDEAMVTPTKRGLLAV